jgi:hypothetical protein
MFVIPISLATALSWMVVPAIILGVLWLLCAIVTGMNKMFSRPLPPPAPAGVYSALFTKGPAPGPIAWTVVLTPIVAFGVAVLFGLLH